MNRENMPVTTSGQVLAHWVSTKPAMARSDIDSQRRDAIMGDHDMSGAHLPARAVNINRNPLRQAVMPRHEHRHDERRQ
jgi:hypothetical protein